MSTENKLKEPITISDKELDEKIADTANKMAQAASLQEQALNKRLYLQGQLELLEQIKKDRMLSKMPEEKSK